MTNISDRLSIENWITEFDQCFNLGTPSEPRLPTTIDGYVLVKVYVRDMIAQAKAQERKRIKSELTRLKPGMAYEPGGKLAAYESGYESAIEEVTELLTKPKEEK